MSSMTNPRAWWVAFLTLPKVPRLIAATVTRNDVALDNTWNDVAVIAARHGLKVVK